MEAEAKAQEDVVSKREEALAEQLKAMRKRKRKLVDPLQFEFSIQAQDLSNYVPAFAHEMMPPSGKQCQSLEKFGIFPDEIDNAGKASLLLDRLHKRMDAGLSTPKQIRFLENRGFNHVGMWSFEDARKMIARISLNNWMVPHTIDPATYQPPKG